MAWYRATGNLPSSNKMGGKEENKSQFHAENLSKEQRCLSSIADHPSVDVPEGQGTRGRNSNDKINTSNKVGTSPWAGGSSPWSPSCVLAKAQPRPSTSEDTTNIEWLQYLRRRSHMVSSRKTRETLLFLSCSVINET